MLWRILNVQLMYWFVESKLKKLQGHKVGAVMNLTFWPVCTDRTDENIKTPKSEISIFERFNFFLVYIFTVHFPCMHNMSNQSAYISCKIKTLNIFHHNSSYLRAIEKYNLSFIICNPINFLSSYLYVKSKLEKQRGHKVVLKVAWF